MAYCENSDSDDESWDTKWHRFTERVVYRFCQVMTIIDNDYDTNGAFFPYYEDDRAYSSMFTGRAAPYAEQNKQFANTCYSMLHFDHQTLLPIGMLLTNEGDGAKYYCVLPPPHDGKTRGLAVTIRRKFNIKNSVAPKAQAHFATYTVANGSVRLDDPDNADANPPCSDFDEEYVWQQQNTMTIDISLPYLRNGLRMVLPSAPMVPFAIYKAIVKKQWAKK